MLLNEGIFELKSLGVSLIYFAELITVIEPVARATGSILASYVRNSGDLECKILLLVIGETVCFRTIVKLTMFFE